MIRADADVKHRAGLVAALTIGDLPLEFQAIAITLVSLRGSGRQIADGLLYGFSPLQRNHPWPTQLTRYRGGIHVCLAQDTTFQSKRSRRQFEPIRPVAHSAYPLLAFGVVQDDQPIRTNPVERTDSLRMVGARREILNLFWLLYLDCPTRRPP